MDLNLGLRERRIGDDPGVLFIERGRSQWEDQLPRLRLELSVDYRPEPWSGQLPSVSL